MYTIKCISTSYHPYNSEWYFYYGEDNYVNSGKNFMYAVKYETYKEALDKAKTLWDNYRYEVKILKIK